MIEVINNNCTQKTKDIITYKEKHGIKFGSEKADAKVETKETAASSGVLVSWLVNFAANKFIEFWFSCDCGCYGDVWIGFGVYGDLVVAGR